MNLLKIAIYIFVALLMFPLIAIGYINSFALVEVTESQLQSAFWLFILSLIVLITYHSTSSSEYRWLITPPNSTDHKKSNKMVYKRDK